MLELHEINTKISSYFESIDEFEILHKALKKQNSHLIYFEFQGEEEPWMHVWIMMRISS